MVQQKNEEIVDARQDTHVKENYTMIYNMKR